MSNFFMFNRFAKSLSILLISFFLLVTVSKAQNQQKQQQEKDQKNQGIVHKVDVVNIEVPVRVFHKGKPVSGLQKKDFKLFIDGKETPINGFHEVRQALTLDETRATEPAAGQTATKPATPAESRLFLLVFHISNYHQDLSDCLDTFFDKIFKPNDRLIVISNHFFFDERTIASPQTEKFKLKKILKLETARNKKKLRLLERQLEMMLFKWKEKSKYGRLKNVGNQDFLNGLGDLIRRYREMFLDINWKDYVRIAQYLKEQKGEKWVLNFYQIGKFLKPKFNSEFFNELNNKDDPSGTGGVFSTPDNNSLSIGPTEDYNRKVNDMISENAFSLEGLSHLFTDSGATFHTILLRDSGAVRNDLASDLSYGAITNSAYRLLKLVSKKTGGTFLETDKVETFYQKMTTKEDVYYLLTYTPEKKAQKSELKINVIKNDKKYRVSYDNRKRTRYLQQDINKSRLPQKQITIENLFLKGKQLSCVVSNFKLVPEVKLPLRLQIFGQSPDKSLYDGVDMFRFNDLKAPRVKLSIAFPKLSPGIYTFFIWVGDPATGKKDLAVQEYKIELKKPVP